MAIRTPMVGIVDLLRLRGNAATDDVFNGVTYWTDEQLLNILDETGVFERVSLTSLDYGDTIFQIDKKHFYHLESGYTLYDVNNSVVASSHTLDPMKNVLTFDAEELNAVYLEGWFYNMYNALSVLYDMKAAHREFYTEIKAGNTKMRLEQEYQQCINRRDYYRNKMARRVSRGRSGRWVS